MPSDEVSPDDAALILHKWMTESTKLQAMLFLPSLGATASVVGVLKRGKDRTLAVFDGNSVDSPNICFDPFRPCTLRYGDSRVFKDNPPVLEFFKRNFTAALTFAYRDRSVLGLFEVSA